MKPQRACSVHRDQAYHHHRQHYCGTCKAIGQAYGQRSRFLLNFDGVFLSELLTHLHGHAVDTWEPRLQTPNTCVTMPVAQAPLALRYAAAATLLFSHLSVNDQIADQNHWKWRFTKRWYNSAFEKALSDLQAWDVDIDFIHQQAQQQFTLEQTTTNPSSIDKQLHYYSQPTQAITAHVFEHSVTDPKQRPIMAQLGQWFGQLLYILDAFEDYEDDVFKGDFNPLAQFWGAPRQLAEPQLDQVRQLLLELGAQCNATLAQLLLEADFVQLQQNRLESNLALRLYQERYLPQTWAERLQQRYQNAQETATDWLCNTQSPLYRLQYYLVVLAVFVSPQTKGYLPLNGKIETVGWMAFATAVLAGLGWVRARRYGPPVDKKKKKRRRRHNKRKPDQGHALQGDCCESCCNDCGEECCDCCRDSCGDCIESACDTCCESFQERPWFTLLWIGVGLVALAGIILLIALLA